MFIEYRQWRTQIFHLMQSADNTKPENFHCIVGMFSLLDKNKLKKYKPGYWFTNTCQCLHKKYTKPCIDCEHPTIKFNQN